MFATYINRISSLSCNLTLTAEWFNLGLAGKNLSRGICTLLTSVIAILDYCYYYTTPSFPGQPG